MTATIRPIQFSALNALDPLHEEEERRENDDRDAYIQQIRHFGLLGEASVTRRGGLAALESIETLVSPHVVRS
jgi:hypothetical protein